MLPWRRITVRVAIPATPNGSNSTATPASSLDYFLIQYSWEYWTYTERSYEGKSDFLLVPILVEYHYEVWKR